MLLVYLLTMATVIDGSFIRLMTPVEIEFRHSKSDIQNRDESRQEIPAFLESAALWASPLTLVLASGQLAQSNWR